MTKSCPPVCPKLNSLLIDSNITSLGACVCFYHVIVIGRNPSVRRYRLSFNSYCAALLLSATSHCISTTPHLYLE